MSYKIKRCFLDLETTGLHPKRNGIIEIGGVIEIGDLHESFNIKARPFEEDEVDPKALAVNKVTPDNILRYQSAERAYQEFKAILLKHINQYQRKDKFHFIGYNAVVFDSPFLRAFFKKAGDNYYGSYFFHPPVDVMVLAAYYLMNARSKMPNFHLSTVAKHMGIAVDEAETHGAMYDVQLTRQLYNKLTEAIKDG